MHINKKTCHGAAGDDAKSSWGGPLAPPTPFQVDWGGIGGPAMRFLHLDQRPGSRRWNCLQVGSLKTIAPHHHIHHHTLHIVPSAFKLHQWPSTILRHHRFIIIKGEIVVANLLLIREDGRRRRQWAMRTHHFVNGHHWWRDRFRDHARREPCDLVRHARPGIRCISSGEGWWSLGDYY